MAIKIDEFGGADWIDGNVLYSADLIDTIYEANNVIGTEGSVDTVISGPTNLTAKITTCNSYTVQVGNTLTLTTAKTHIIVARESITIAGTIDGTGAGGDGGVAEGQDGDIGLCSAGGYGGSGAGAPGGSGYTNYIDSTTSSGAFSTTFRDAQEFTILNPEFMNAWAINYSTLFGAGGGAGDDDVGSSTYGAGGKGGAGLILIAPSITISGTITLSGNNGTSASGGTGGAGGGGGGAGGPLFIFAKDTLVLTGATLTSDGGNGGAALTPVPGGGGAAGGLIDYLYGSLTGSPTISVAAGTGGAGNPAGQNGSAGDTLAYTWRGA